MAAYERTVVAPRGRRRSFEIVARRVAALSDPPGSVWSVPTAVLDDRTRATGVEHGVGRAAAALAGAVAAGMALAAGELAVAVSGAQPSLVTAVGSEVIDRFAAALKDIAVAIFGTNDKAALVIGIVLTSILLGALLGIAARRRFGVAVAGFTTFGAIGAAALTSDPQGAAGVALVAATIAVVAGIASLWLLLRLASGPPARPSTSPRPPAAQVPSPHVPSPRREFLVGAATLAAVGVVAVAAARRLRMDGAVETVRRTLRLPSPGSRVAAPATQPIDVTGISPYITPVADFYRIDTALSTPQVDPTSWRLAITGMVDAPFELTYDDLLALDSIEVPVTIQCVSNEVGGDLVGTAMWQGVPLAAILERAGVQDGATQIVGRSVDGWTAGFPTAAAFDGRTALVAFAMNGDALAAKHGFPARLVVAGLYGYVSATKWLREIELTTLDAFDGYWIPRGWAKEAPIKTTSRIDVARTGADVPAGSVVLGGVAWAPNVGIDAVEVQIDGGPWRAADLGAVASDDTWVQWRLVADVGVGEHTARVRAIDRTGAVQTDAEAPPAPDGATGLHAGRFTIA
jgi:DMSO/TMAO reductase YedYZ molybdopterin-dependent catalytic subunit